MNKNALVKYCIVSLFLIASIMLLAFVFVRPKSDLGNTFEVGIFYIALRYLCLYGALFIFMIRIFIFRRTRQYFFYTLIGMFNCCIGILAIYLFFFNQYSREWLHLCLLNLLIGTVLLFDAYFFFVLPMSKNTK